MTLSEELTPYLQTLNRTGTLKLPQELYNKVRQQHLYDKGKNLPACSSCLEAYIREICRQ